MTVRQGKRLRLFDKSQAHPSSTTSPRALINRNCIPILYYNSPVRVPDNKKIVLPQIEGLAAPNFPHYPREISAQDLFDAGVGMAAC